MNDGQEEKLRAALAGVPDEMRRCFLLRYVQGFEEHEIAILMKIPLEMVRMNLYQAMRWLRSGGAHGQ